DPQALLELVAPAALLALVEVGLRRGHFLIGEDVVEVRLHPLLAVRARVVHFPLRRRTCRRLRSLLNSVERTFMSPPPGRTRPAPASGCGVLVAASTSPCQPGCRGSGPYPRS